ncbi:hypothetical protein ACFWPQ_11680 [Streptomyces sp. NPDC058464]|uniref:hypothetical protein n=1 Tax=Streptomyces sp. NPDC058464 TaxID=3346511 RepID=UPI003655BB01
MAGSLFAGAGVVAVFISANQAGSTTLVLIGALFLLMAVSGRTIESVRIGDWEFTMSELRRQAAEQARSGQTDQAQAMLNVLKQLDPAADRDPAVHAVEITVFENRVVDAVEAARSEGDQVERHPDSGLGEPLAVLVARPDGVRIGVFAAYALDESGHISATSSDSFVRRAREVDCAAYLFVNGTLHQDDLARLADGIQRDGGRPVDTETWASIAQSAPLRPAIDRLLARVRGRQDERATIPGQ